MTIAILAILVFLFRGLLKHDFKIFARNLKRYVPFVLIGAVVMMLFATIGENISANLVSYVLPNQTANAEAFAAYPVLAAIQMILCAPFIEELIFRRAIKVLAPNKIVY